MIFPYKCSICGKLEPPPFNNGLITLALVTSSLIHGHRAIPVSDLYCSRTGDCAIVQCPYCGWLVQVGEHTEDICYRCKLAADMRDQPQSEELRFEDVLREAEAILNTNN